MDLLSTSGINQLVDQFSSYERYKQITHLQTRKSKYSNLSSAWGTVRSNLTSLKTSLSKLKSTSTSSLFGAKKTDLSSSSFLTATAQNGATVSAYNLRVNQLAKNDLLVSSSLDSNTDVTTLSGTHKFKITSGDYHGNVEVELTGTETNDTLMEKIASAINDDKAAVTSTDIGSFTGAGELKFDVGGTETSISYDKTGQSYADLVDDLVTQINDNVSGVLAENVDGNLQITVSNSDKALTISDASGSLASNLGINVTNEKGASAIATASDFNPTTSKSKFSISADKSGYDNRLIIENVSGGLLDHVGLTSAVLTGRETGGDDDAGFMFSATSETDNALNAKLLFNGINIQRNDNTFDDLVKDVSFSLKATMEDTDSDVNVAITHDTDSIKSDIESFIESFNTSYTYIKNNYTSSETAGRGLFTGDSVALSLMRNFQVTAMQNISGLEANDYKSLREIGISFEPSTGLSISDSSKLTTALEDSSDQVASIFNSDNGVAKSLYDTLENYLGSNGTISNITNQYDNNISYLNDKITATEERIDKSAEVLRAKYQAMQTQYATILNSANYISSLGGGLF
ncbi:MAG: flagellar filament capping protein FliD [Melioribacteraceae bacterium]|nr:flagellar filament capping protein FliD [Melioribacteraceae bacterium]